MSQLNEERKTQTMPDESAFECHICLEIAIEPVITPCGHLFCWPCIYHWLNSNQEFLTCPVCKNGTSAKQIIPLYTKQDDDNTSNKLNSFLHQFRKPRDPNIPPRPKPTRNQPVRNQNSIGNGALTTNYNNLNNGQMLAGYGLFPPIYNLNFVKHPDFPFTDDLDAGRTEEKLLPKLQLALGTMLMFTLAVFLMYI